MAAKTPKKNVVSPHIRDEFFVGVSQPTAIRISFLQSKRSVLESLRLFAELKEIRKQKIGLKKQIRKNVRQINIYLNQITAMLPHVHLDMHEENKAVELNMPTEEKEAPAQEQRPQSQSPIDKIEAQLREIEGRLSTLQ